MSYAHDLGQSMLKIDSVPKENGTVQQMTLSATGFRVYCIQAVTCSTVLFSFISKKLP